MQTFVWHPKRSDIGNAQLAAIMRLVLDAGIPMESALIKTRGHLLNFKDEATVEQMEQALQIAEAYDPAAAAEAALEARRQRAVDLRPFKQIKTLLDDNMRDAAAVDGATLAQLRLLLQNLLGREAKMLKGMARLLENYVVEEDE